MSNISREKAKAAGWKPVNEQEAFPEHIREWSFQLWAYKCARDSKRVAAYMRAGEYDGTNEVFPPTIIADRTIREWSKRYHWAEQQLKDNKALHADKFNIVQIQNINNSVDAVRVQAEVLSMLKEDIEHKQAWAPDPENPKRTPPSLRLDAREIKAIADFTNGILDRAGHMAYTRKDTTERPTGPSIDFADAIGGKSTDELMAMAGMQIFEIAAKASPRIAGESPANLNTDDQSVIEVSPHDPHRSVDPGAS